MTAKLAFVTFLAASAVAAPALAQEDRQFEATTLRLSSRGEAHAAPDIATINLGVQTEAPSAADALRQNRTQMTGTIAALKAQGVLAKDIQTSGLSLNPQYAFHDNERHLTGYQASNAVTITVRDLSRLGATVDAVVAAGANQVNGVNFSLSDPQHAEDEARRAAVKALEAKAALRRSRRLSRGAAGEPKRHRFIAGCRSPSNVCPGAGARHSNLHSRRAGRTGRRRHSQRGLRTEEIARQNSAEGDGARRRC